MRFVWPSVGGAGGAVGLFGVGELNKSPALFQSPSVPADPNVLPQLSPKGWFMVLTGAFKVSPIKPPLGAMGASLLISTHCVVSEQISIETFKRRLWSKSYCCRMAQNYSLLRIWGGFSCDLAFCLKRHQTRRRLTGGTVTHRDNVNTRSWLAFHARSIGREAAALYGARCAS